MSVTDKLYVEKILKKFTITDYLASKGIQSVSYKGQRTQYECPLPSHKDSKPSFFVFHNTEFESFHCFGCSEHGTIIKLYRLLERVTFRKTIDHFAKGIAVDSSVLMDVIISEAHKPDFVDHADDLDTKDISAEIADLAIGLSLSCYAQIKKNIDFDPEFVTLIDRAFEKLDIAIRQMDVDQLLKLCLIMSDEAFPKINRLYQEKQESKLISAS